MAATARIRLASVIVALILVVFNGVSALWQHRLPPVPGEHMRVGIDPSLAPFAYYDGNQIIGFEIDVAQAVADELHVEIEWVLLGFDGLYDALRAERVDVVIASLSPDPLRTGDAVFTVPYYDAGLVLVSPLARGAGSMQEVSGRRLAYAYGSAGDTEAGRWLRRIRPFTLQPYELPTFALDAVRLAQADAALVSTTDAQLYMRVHSSWETMIVPVTHQPFVMAVAPRLADRLAPAINAAISHLDKAGTLAMLRRRWLY